MNIPKDILEFHKLFNDAGYKLHIVGGCVRDYIMGIEPHDFDLVTDASPEVVKNILANYNKYISV